MPFTFLVTFLADEVCWLDLLWSSLNPSMLTFLIKRNISNHFSNASEMLRTNHFYSTFQYHVFLLKPHHVVLVFVDFLKDCIVKLNNTTWFHWKHYPESKDIMMFILIILVVLLFYYHGFRALCFEVWSELFIPSLGS